VPITTIVVSSNPFHDEVYSIIQDTLKNGRLKRILSSLNGWFTISIITEITRRKLFRYASSDIFGTSRQLWASLEGRRGRDRMVVGFTTTSNISAYHHYSCEFEPLSWRGVLDTTLCDKVCQWLTGSGKSNYHTITTTTTLKWGQKSKWPISLAWTK
jgi:hypothetical protein